MIPRWMREATGQFIRYGLSGGAAVATLFLVLVCLVEVLGVPSTVASALAFACAVPVNYGLQHRFVFHRSSGHALYFPRYLATTAFTVGLNTALFWALTQELKIGYVMSQAITLCAVVPVSFLINRNFTFHDLKAPQPSEPPTGEGAARA